MKSTSNPHNAQPTGPYTVLTATSRGLYRIYAVELVWTTSCRKTTSKHKQCNPFDTHTKCSPPSGYGCCDKAQSKVTEKICSKTNALESQSTRIKFTFHSTTSLPKQTPTSSSKCRSVLVYFGRFHLWERNLVRLPADHLAHTTYHVDVCVCAEPVLNFLSSGFKMEFRHSKKCILR